MLLVPPPWLLFLLLPPPWAEADEMKPGSSSGSLSSEFELRRLMRPWAEWYMLICNCVVVFSLSLCTIVYTAATLIRSRCVVSLVFVFFFANKTRSKISDKVEGEISTEDTKWHKMCLGTIRMDDSIRDEREK